MEALPQELIETINSFLDDRSRRIIRVASTKWFNTIQYSTFIFYRTKEEQYMQIFQRLQKYNFPIKISFNKPKGRLTKNTCIELGKLTQLTGLLLEPQRMLALPKKSHIWPLTNLTNLQSANFRVGSLNNFTNLKELTVHEFTNEVVDIPRLPNLELLELRVREVGNFGFLPKLTSLTIKTDELNDFKTFTRLTALKRFQIDLSYIFVYTKDLMFMTALTNLEDFTFEGPKELLSYISSNKLTALTLHNKFSMSNMSPNIYSYLQKLQLISNKSLTPDILRNFTNLTELNLKGVTKVEGLFEAIETLKKLKKLKLDINNGLLNDKNRNALQIQHLTALGDLTLRLHCDILPLDLSRIGPLTLKKINLDCMITEEIFNHFLSVTSLKKLKLANGGLISDDMIAQLSILSNLTNLYLGGVDNQMTGVTLTCLTSLRALFLESNAPLSVNEQYLKDVIPRLDNVTFEFI